MLHQGDWLNPQCWQQDLDILLARLSEHYCVDERAWLGELIAFVDADLGDEPTLHAATVAMVNQVRSRPGAAHALDALLREYSLASHEGLMLMCLAEALLRIPDAATVDALIEDKLGPADWRGHLGHSPDWLVNLSSWGLLLCGQLVQRHQQTAPPAGAFVDTLLGRLGEPLMRRALLQAMKLMGRQFVLGEDMTAALRRSRPLFRLGQTCSYDMLGEAACSQEVAKRYYHAYRSAILAVAAQALAADVPPPSISIKLSALHPRYAFARREQMLAELVPSLGELVALARQHQVAITLDAEEADRLELSLEIFRAVLEQQGRGWGSFGLAVQAYSKRALPTLHYLTRLAQLTVTQIPVRLVKGAYWDTEIKRAQQLGLADYPVFTRKAGTDLSYLACARYLLSDACAGHLFPQFASHNAHTLCWLLQRANRPLEFQRLHGMGEALHQAVLERAPPGSYCRVYAPVGAYRELLPYLVRRLLENGANSSFVHQLLDPAVPVASLARHPLHELAELPDLRHPQIPLPGDLYGTSRANAAGLNLAIRSHYEPLRRAMAPYMQQHYRAQPLLAAAVTAADGPARPVLNPHNGLPVGECRDCGEVQRQQALAHAQAAFPGWNATPVAQRAAIIRRLADLLEVHRPELMALCCREAGKTLADGLAEVREAVDFCRYYAAQAEQCLVTPLTLPGPTGEDNRLQLEGRGVFAVICPWNFPLAILLGQCSAALLAGNTVLVKPAEQTSLIAFRAVSLAHQAGVPRAVLQLLPGDGPTVAAPLCAEPALAGVAFTGSTETARAINQTLAGRVAAPLATLVAETGGLNALIADASALPEQLVADVLHSAFASAGQRCSALRVLYLQEEMAAPVLALLAGAMAELQVGDPASLATDVGPVIDRDAWQRLDRHCRKLTSQGRLLARSPLDPAQHAQGWFVAPQLFALDSLAQLDHEPFGPVLHVIRYRADDIEQVVEQINASGYGLTAGIHSRNQQFAERLAAWLRVGNIYINRDMVGAAVGVQPFGGQGLSGTGPKAGGPYYLLRFTSEKTITTNTAALGGNATLLGLKAE